MSCLFGTEPTPGVIFRDYDDFCSIRDNILCRLELDPSKFDDRNKFSREISKRPRTPSPIRRIEDTNSVMFFGGVNTSNIVHLDASLDQTDHILTFAEDSESNTFNVSNKISKRSFQQAAAEPDPLNILNEGSAEEEKKANEA